MRFRRGLTPPGPAKSTAARMLLAALAGLLSIAAFAPFAYWPLQMLSLAILFYQMLRGASVKSGILIGWAYGFGAAFGVYWLFIAMHRFGGLAAPLAAMAIVLLALFLGSYSALGMGLAAWLRKRWRLPLPATLLLLLPSMWAFSEWLRGWLFTGFPWLSAGYAYNNSPLAGFAPILGVYGLGWLAALGAGALLLLTHRTRWLALGGLVVLFATGFGLQQINWTHPVGRPITVRLLQGNIAQDEKFDLKHISSALQLYHADITAQPADLIATPETAFALLPQQLPNDYLSSLRQFALQSNSTLLLGMPLSDSPSAFYNGALGIGPLGSSPLYRYNKHHLVPMGEFIPTGLHWFVQMLAIPLGDFNRGAPVQAPLRVGDQQVLPNICYEDLFGEEIAEQLAAAHGAGRQSASILLNMANMAWYGESSAIPQHLQISQMRSLETGRPMLRATNSGATAVIDGHGVILSQLAPYTHGTLATTVQGMGGMTPYILCGNKLLLALAALALFGAWLWGRRSTH